MATLIVQQGGGGGTFSSLAAALAAANIGDTIQIQGAWTIPDPGGPVTPNKASVLIEAVGAAATKGVVDEVSGTYWRLINTSNAHAINCLAEGITLRGLTVKVAHNFNGKGAIRLRTTGTVEDCVLYGAATGSGVDQDGVSVTPNLHNYNVIVSNTLFFKLRGAGVVSENTGLDVTMDGLIRVRGCSFVRNLTGIERRGLPGENDIGVLVHSCNFVLNDLGIDADASIWWTDKELPTLADPHQFWVDYCISDDGGITHVNFESNVSPLTAQSGTDVSTASGQLFLEWDTYPYNFNLLEATGAGNNVLVDYHSNLNYVQVPPFITNNIQSTSLNDANRDPNNVDVGAFELVKAVVGNVIQDLPFIEQSASGVAGLLTAQVETDAPFIEHKTMFGGPLVTGMAAQDLPFFEQDLLGDVIVRGSSVQDLPFIDLALAGTLPDQEIEGNIVQDLPFIDQSLAGVGRRIWQIETDAPFIDIVGGVTTFSIGDVIQDLPFIEQDAAGVVQTVSHIDQDLPFIEQALAGDVIVEGAIVQDLPFITQQLEQLDVWSSATINTDAPFIDQALIGSPNVIGNINQELPFLETEDEPGEITMTLPFIEQQLEGTSARVSNIVQDLPFIDQQAFGGVLELRAGDIGMELPFIDTSAHGRAIRAGDIDQDLPFIENTAVGEVNVVGDAVQDLPFIEMDARGPGALADTALTRVCEHGLFMTAALHTLRMVPVKRRLRVTAVRRRLRFVCQTFNAGRIKTVPIPAEMIGGAPLVDMEGRAIEFLVEVE